MTAPVTRAGMDHSKSLFELNLVNGFQYPNSVIANIWGAYGGLQAIIQPGDPNRFPIPTNYRPQL